jgi:hypothetical protein
MLDISAKPVSIPMRSSIYLEYGLDESECDTKELEVCDRGMRFQSRWRFQIGAQLIVSLPGVGTGDCDQKLQVEGIVVECEKTACRCYRTALFFLDLPASDLEALRTLAARGRFTATQGA